MRRVRLGISRLTEVFEAAGKGDLSSPSDVRSFKELVNFGTEVDEVRSYTLALIEEIRGEAKAIRTSDLSQVEFAKRWEALKEKIGRIAPLARGEGAGGILLRAMRSGDSSFFSGSPFPCWERSSS